MRITLDKRLIQVDVTFTKFTPSYGIGLKYSTQADCVISEIKNGETIRLGSASVRFKKTERFTRNLGSSRAIAAALKETNITRFHRKYLWEAYWNGKFHMCVLAKARRREMLRQKHTTASSLLLKSLRKAV